MNVERLNIDFPSDEYTYLKMLCAVKGITIKDFVIPIILRAMDEEEDAILAKKAQRRLKNISNSDLIPIDEAFMEAGWDVKEI